MHLIEPQPNIQLSYSNFHLCSHELRNMPRSSKCDLCPRGTFSNHSQHGQARDSCTPCLAGRYTAALGTVECPACAKGMATFGAAGSSSCFICGAGTVAVKEGSAICTLCPPGKVNLDFSTNASMHKSTSKDCAKCVPGKFSSTTRSACEICPSGTCKC